jgi:signal transduction histidine kinase
MTEWQSADRLALYLPLKLSDGTSLTLELMPPKPTVSGTTVLLLLLQLAALGAAAWFAVRLAVRPVALLAQAADALRPGTAGGLRLSQTGPREVDQAVRAFQAMQGRIDKQLSERLHLLASISHDLQTPIARMRLRAEQLGDDALRGKMLADLQGMQRLVDEGLTYAKTAHAAQEVERPVDVMALLDGLVCDASDAGHRVTLSGDEQPHRQRHQIWRPR